VNLEEITEMRNANAVVVDVEAHYTKTKREGGTIWEELHETIYGERQYGVTDLEGHRWSFSQHARDVNPESWGATVVSRNFEYVRRFLSVRLPGLTLTPH